MQLLNKNAIKNTFFHTWYLYPISIVIITLLWIWGFGAFHQPTNHQRITIFLSCDVKDESFLYDIMNENYEKENLREIVPSYALPDSVGFLSKLQLAMSNADMMIIDENTLKGFANSYQSYLVELNDYILNNYLKGTYHYYDFVDKHYGIRIKEAGVDNYFNNYLTYKEEQDYYLVLMTGSVNLGAYEDENNAYYDNALTYASYLLELNA